MQKTGIDRISDDLVHFEAYRLTPLAFEFYPRQKGGVDSSILVSREIGLVGIETVFV